MHPLKTGTLLLIAAFITNISFAQNEENETDTTASEKKGSRRHREMKMSMHGGSPIPTPIRRWYVSNSFDGAIFSTAVFEKPGHDRELTTLRFSLLNIGHHYNYDFD